MKNLYNALQLKQLYQLKHLGYQYTDIKPFLYGHRDAIKLPNDLDQLNKQAQNCYLCLLSKQRQRVVCGKGNPCAEIMFIGEYPSTLEDKEGKIFLGRSGEMLTAMIENALQIPPKNIYLTNLLKCHPPTSQTLHKSVIHTCKAYLFKEIEIIQPKIIVTLGEMPYFYLTNDTTPLKEIRGNIIKLQNYTLIPTYHPNFLLKNPSYKKEVFIDLQQINTLI